MPKKTKVTPKKVSIPSVGATTTQKAKSAPVTPELPRKMQTATKHLIAKAKLDGLKTVITPDIAADLLTLNNNNRRVKRERVILYASAMKRGQWAYTGDSIRVGTDDQDNLVLLDGQHRLLACVEAGVPFDAMLISGLPTSVFTVIDRGVVRSNGDVLKIAGFANSTFVGAMVRPVIALDAGLNPMTHGSMQLVTGDDLVAFCTEHGDMVEWAKNLGTKAKYHIGCVNSAWGIFSLLAAQKRGRRLIEQFTDETCAGVELNAGDPRLALRSFFLKTGTTVGPAAPNFREAGTIMNAFNAYIDGRKMKTIRQWGLKTDAEFPKVSMATPFDWKHGTPSESDEN